MGQLRIAYLGEGAGVDLVNAKITNDVFVGLLAFGLQLTYCDQVVEAIVQAQAKRISPKR